MKPTSQQSGVMIIEALIGILIFMIGILALIAMQATAIRATQDARYRTEAVNYANDLLNKIVVNVDRTNPATLQTSLAAFQHQPTTGAHCSYSGAASANAMLLDWEELAHRNERPYAATTQAASGHRRDDGPGARQYGRGRLQHRVHHPVLARTGRSGRPQARPGVLHLMKTTATRQRGMSLIEIMVGVLIGLIGCVLIFQVYGTAEARKRSVASGSDMDISGRLGLMTLERDIQLAGYGFGTGASSTAGVGGVLGCTVTAFDNTRAGALQDFNFALAPVIIQDGVGGAPDTIITLRGTSSFVVAPKIIDASAATTKKLKADTGGRAGILRGDLVVAVTYLPALACAMFEITGDTNADQLTFDHATGNYTTAAGVNKGARYNKAGGVAFDLDGEGSLFNLGANPVRNIWSIQDNKLAVANDLLAKRPDGRCGPHRRPAGAVRHRRRERRAGRRNDFGRRVDQCRPRRCGAMGTAPCRALRAPHAQHPVRDHEGHDRQPALVGCRLHDAQRQRRRRYQPGRHERRRQ